MTDPEFMDLAEKLLQSVESRCDQLNEAADVDIDNQRVGGMITLIFANSSQIVINLQKPLHEVWLAAKSGGYHYRHDGRQWANTKGGPEFFEQLSQCAREQTGQALVFTP